MKAISALGILSIVLLAACAPKNISTPTGSPPLVINPSGTSAAGTATINIQNFRFDPAELTIVAGTSVSWTNQDSVVHTITADDNSWGSGNLGQGDTYSFTFNQPGTYPYHCGVHPTMQAAITVVPQ